jgi:hypothetical protein
MSAPQKSYTDYPNGVTSFGIPLPAGGGKLITTPFGRTWFVNANNTVPNAGWGPGSDGNSGTSPTTPFQTMERAFESVGSGDVINFVGKLDEQLVTPEQVFDVWINGCGTQPRHADSTPDGGQYGAAQWGAASGTVGVATLRVLQQGWRFTNFLFTARDATAACVELVRNAAAGDDERDASHASFYGVRFSGAGIGIKSGVAALFTEIVANVKVIGCQFDNMTEAIQGAIEVNQWEIAHNFFGPNTSQIDLPARNCYIHDNLIGPFTAAGNSGGIDLAGGTGLNFVVKNVLSGTYSSAGGYTVANANDTWLGNIANGLGGADQLGLFTTSDPA